MDEIIASFLLGVSITLAIIGVILWKLVHFEIKGEHYHYMKVRERITEGVGKNIAALGLFSVILAVLYKYRDWFNMIRTGLLMFLLVLVVIVRISCIEELYEKKQK